MTSRQPSNNNEARKRLKDNPLRTEPRAGTVSSNFMPTIHEGATMTRGLVPLLLLTVYACVTVTITEDE